MPADGDEGLLREKYTNPGERRIESDWLDPKEVIRFLTVGFSGLFVDIGVFTILILIIGDNSVRLPLIGVVLLVYIYQIISFLCAVSWNFTLNRNWTFEIRGGGKGIQFLKYLSVTIIGLALRTGTIFAGVEIIGVSGQPWYQILICLAIGITTPVNYLGTKFWTFK